jgi:hypothetical protein
MVGTQSRVGVANAVAVIVQRFAGMPAVRYVDADVAEQAVRDMAARAEGASLDGQVVSSALDGACLLDDYVRIKRGGSHRIAELADLPNGADTAPGQQMNIGDGRGAHAVHDWCTNSMRTFRSYRRAHSYAAKLQNDGHAIDVWQEMPYGDDLTRWPGLVANA